MVRVASLGAGLENTEMRGFAAPPIRAPELHEEGAALLNPDTEVMGGAIERLSGTWTTTRMRLCRAAAVYHDGRLQHLVFPLSYPRDDLLDLFPTNHRVMASHLNGRYPLPRTGRRARWIIPRACMLIPRAAGRTWRARRGLPDVRRKVDWCYGPCSEGGEFIKYPRPACASGGASARQLPTPGRGAAPQPATVLRQALRPGFVAATAHCSASAWRGSGAAGARSPRRRHRERRVPPSRSRAGAHLIL